MDVPVDVESSLAMVRLDRFQAMLLRVAEGELEEAEQETRDWNRKLE